MINSTVFRRPLVVVALVCAGLLAVIAASEVLATRNAFPTSIPSAVGRGEYATSVDRKFLLVLSLVGSNGGKIEIYRAGDEQSSLPLERFSLQNFRPGYVCWSEVGHTVWIARKNSVVRLTEAADGRWSDAAGFPKADMPAPCVEQAPKGLFSSAPPSDLSQPSLVLRCPDDQTIRC
jgi:hypothetical protein